MGKKDCCIADRRHRKRAVTVAHFPAAETGGIPKGISSPFPILIQYPLHQCPLFLGGGACYCCFGSARAIAFSAAGEHRFQEGREGGNCVITPNNWGGIFLPPLPSLPRSVCFCACFVGQPPCSFLLALIERRHRSSPLGESAEEKASQQDVGNSGL